MQSKNFYVIIIGGGIMGSSTAYHLMMADPSLKVIVTEKELGYEKASTTLSMVNARIQFSLKENVQISQYAFKVLENFAWITAGTCVGRYMTELKYLAESLYHMAQYRISGLNQNKI